MRQQHESVLNEFLLYAKVRCHTHARVSLLRCSRLTCVVPRVAQNAVHGRCQVQGHLVVGDPRDALIAESAKLQAQGVVFGSRGLGQISGALLGPRLWGEGGGMQRGCGLSCTCAMRSHAARCGQAL